MEDRLTPSAAVSLQATPLGDTLVVQGTGADDKIEMWEDQGNNNIRVLVDSTFEYNFPTQSYDRIEMDLGDGDDVVHYYLTDDLTDARTIDVDLGRGNVNGYLNTGYDAAEFRFDGNGQIAIRDTLDLTIRGSTRFNGGRHYIGVGLGRIEADVNVNLLGGHGDDTLAVGLFGDIEDGTTVLNLDGNVGQDRLFVTTGYSGTVEIDNDAVLDVNMNGGFHDDLLFFQYMGELDGLLRLRADGYFGDDDVIARFEVDPASDGQIDAAITGGWGNDDVSMLFTESIKKADVEILQALVDGGEDYDDDEARITSEVTAQNFDEVTVIANPTTLRTQK